MGREEEDPLKRMRGGLALAAVAAIAVGACTSSGGGSAAPSLPTTVGEGEGALTLVAWAGYVVGGTGGEQVEGYDWVSPFEEATGCNVTVKVGLDSANMVQLMKTGEYDGVSASGDATLRLIAGGDVLPVNLDLSRTTRTSSGPRTSPTTRSTASATACPTVRGANV
jgi:putative spermidine/putrescine transport system substrate-binding protein